MPISINAITGDDLIVFVEGDSGITLSGTKTNLSFPLTDAIELKIFNSLGTQIYTSSFTQDGTNWSHVWSPGALADGTYTLSVDLTGDGVSDPPTTRSFTVERTRPTLNSITISDNEVRPGETALVTFQFSEAVTGFTVGDVAVQFGSLSNFTAVDGDTYTATFAPSTTQEGQGRISVWSGNGLPSSFPWTDLAGNGPSNPNTFVESGIYKVDGLAPRPGTIGFSGLTDTGSSNTPIITADAIFSVVAVTAPTDLTPPRTDFQRSFNGGAFQFVSGLESNLADGHYRYRALYTDSFNNTSFSIVIEVIIDTAAPVAGTLAFANLTDSGSDDAPDVTTDNSFDLTLSGQEASTAVTYQVSGDDGVTWQTTTAGQSGLADGSYRFRAAVADAAGNTSTTGEIVVTVDRVAIAGVLGFAGLLDTGSNDVQPVTTDDTFTLVLSAQESNATIVYEVSTDGGTTWSSTGTVQSGLADATYQFRARLTDRAGNSAAGDAVQVTVDHRAPAAGVVDFANMIGGANGVTSDNTFDLTLTGQESGATVVFQVSGDGGTTWLTSVAVQSDLPNGAYRFRAFVSDAAGNLSITPERSITINATTGANQPPIAVGAPFTVNEDQLLNGTLIGSDPDGTPVTYLLVAQAAHGTVTVNPDGTFSYTPQENFFGTDSFTFKTNDGAADSNVATGTVTVNAVNDAPVNTVPGAFDMQGNHTLALTGLAVADVDAGAGSIRTMLSVQHGLLTASSAGGATAFGSNSSQLRFFGTAEQITAALATVSYKPRYDFFGDDTLTMVTNDDGRTGGGGNLSDTDTVTIHVNTLVTGTPGNDTFTALATQARFDAGAGVDTAIFHFKFTDAEIGSGSDGVSSVTFGSDANWPDVSHTVLTGVERLVFADGTVVLDDNDRLVDDLTYFHNNPDVWKSGIDADQHYHTTGWREGRDPNILFDTKLYLLRNPDVRAMGMDPLLHYDTIGWKEGRDPHGFFDTSAYLDANPDVKAAGFNPLWHFLTFGMAEGREAPRAQMFTANGFDYFEYWWLNTDVRNAGVDPFVHFQTVGWKEGRDPNALFDTAGYLAAYADVKAAGINPLDHYHEVGWKEGRDPSPDFDTTAYLAAYQDVAAAGVDPLLHYLTSGRFEGRSAFGDGVFG